MWHFQVLLGSGALVLLALLLDLARALGWRRPPLYRMPTHWLDPAERALLAVLESILGDEYRLLHRVRVADLGVDAMHINLHKTFSSPHGGGGQHSRCL